MRTNVRTVVNSCYKKVTVMITAVFWGRCYFPSTRTENKVKTMLFSVLDLNPNPTANRVRLKCDRRDRYDRQDC